MTLYTNTYIRPFTHVLTTPISISLSYFWNLGSILGLVLINQLLTGLFLVIFYTSDATLAFISVEYIIRETNSGWLLRLIHFNGASLFFLCLFLHISRGIILGSFRLWNPWTTGILLFACVIGEAFIGYVLPWGQISVWGACVITSLLSVIPFIGETVVVWVWGGFVVNSATLGCFFILHYLLPFIILVIIILHILFLHETGSSSSCGSSDSDSNIKFFPYFIINDLINLSLFSLFISFCCLLPFTLGDCENLNEANLISSPIHIQPEWYFLLAYAILRAIPNNLGGVIALLLSIVAIWALCALPSSPQTNYTCLYLFFFSLLSATTVTLTFLGASPVEPPFIFFSQLLTGSYFLLLFCLFALSAFLF